MMEKRDPAIWTEISATAKGGRKVQGWFRTHDLMVTVETAQGRKTAYIGGFDPTTLAEALLRELADNGLA